MIIPLWNTRCLSQKTVTYLFIVGTQMLTEMDIVDSYAHFRQALMTAVAETFVNV